MTVDRRAATVRHTAARAFAAFVLLGVAAPMAGARAGTSETAGTGRPAVPTPARPAPAGIFCSCPPTSARSHSVLPAVAARPFVTGILVRVAWSDLEAVEDRPDWSLLDAELALARSSGKQVALAVVNGPAAPGWLANRGAARFDYSFRGAPATLPVPWDPVYLAAWDRFVGQLGQRYHDDPTIALVHVTHSSANGFEMQLPFTPTDQQHWQQLGYTADRHVASWRGVVNAFAAAFPDTWLDVEVHPVLGSDAVAEQVAAHGHQTQGDRFGLFGAWWSRHNATSAYPGMYRLVQGSARHGFAATQMVASFTRGYGEHFGQPSPAAALTDTVTRLGLEETGVRYFEIWNEDLLNEALAPLLTEVAARLARPRALYLPLARRSG